MENHEQELKRIKINLPYDEKDYINGNGEGCWALITPQILRYYKSDIVEMEFTAILDNDSVYYPNLKAGMAIACEMRGGHRPVAIYSQLQQYRPDGYGVFNIIFQ